MCTSLTIEISITVMIDHQITLGFKVFLHSIQLISTIRTLMVFIV